MTRIALHIWLVRQIIKDVKIVIGLKSYHHISGGKLSCGKKPGGKLLKDIKIGIVRHYAKIDQDT